MNIIINTSNKQLQHQEEPNNSFAEFSGMWKDRDITQESIREQAWK